MEVGVGTTEAWSRVAGAVPLGIAFAPWGTVVVDVVDETRNGTSMTDFRRSDLEEKRETSEYVSEYGGASRPSPPDLERFYR